MIPHCFVSWHHLSWRKGTFGSLYGDYVFILLAEIKVMMRKEIRISSDRAQEMLKRKKQQHVLIHQDKIQPYIRRRLNLKWLEKDINQTEINECKNPTWSPSASLMVLQTFKISIVTLLTACLNLQRFLHTEISRSPIIDS